MNNSSNASSHQLMTALVLASDVDMKKIEADIELQRGRPLSIEICLWLCKWGMQEGMQYFHTLQNFVSPVSPPQHCNRQKRQTWAEKQEAN